jgi:hypothetical protein
MSCQNFPFFFSSDADLPKNMIIMDYDKNIGNYLLTWCHILEYLHLHQHFYENLKSYTVYSFI